MAAGKYDIVIDQGSDFAIEVQIQQNSANVNLRVTPEVTR